MGSDGSTVTYAGYPVIDRGERAVWSDSGSISRAVALVQARSGQCERGGGRAKRALVQGCPDGCGENLLEVEM